MLSQLLRLGRGTLSPHSGDYDYDASVLLGEERQRLSAAELYYVTEDLTRLAQAAAETLPVGFHPDDLPSPFGFILFAEPLGIYRPDPDPRGLATHDEVAVVAASWGATNAIPRDQGFWVTFWAVTNFESEARDLQKHARMSRSEAMRRVRQQRAELTWDNEITFKFGATEIKLLSNEHPGVAFDQGDAAEGGWEQIRGTTLAWAHIVRAAWLLMTQDGVTDVAEEHLPRSVRRRADRAGHNSSPVRVVRIRHRENAPISTPADDDTSRTYRVRWTVRGHWRQQWYPSRGEHRAVWINPHIKGPQHAPLHASETVHLLD